MKFEVLGKTQVGSSMTNGDVFYISEDNKFLMLADGASGAGADGKVLMGRICIETVKEYTFNPASMKADEYLDKLLWKINNKLIDVSQERKGKVFGTIVLALINNDVLTVTTLGDSVAYFYDGNKTVELARSPRGYEWMIDRGYITREDYEGYISNMHPMMWSCFNNFLPMVVPNNKIEKRTIKKGDILALCCDGISDWISIEDIVKEIQGKELEIALSNIVETSKVRSLESNNYYDDLTIVSLKCIE